MSQPEQLLVTDKNGLRGTIDPTAPPPFDGSGPQVLVRLANGQEVIVPTEALVARKERGYFLPLSLSELEAPPVPPSARKERSQDFLTVPVVAEELSVEKRKVETGRVRITKTVHEHQEVVDELLLQEEVDVRRVAINQVVDAPPPVRYEGDTMIIPLLEEVLVVEKRLMLKEELHVSKRQTSTHQPQQVTLRREEATIERFDSRERQEDGTRER